jgi:hypothetical protein
MNGAASCGHSAPGINAWHPSKCPAVAGPSMTARMRRRWWRVVAPASKLDRAVGCSTGRTFEQRNSQELLACSTVATLVSPGA